MKSLKWCAKVVETWPAWVCKHNTPITDAIYMDLGALIRQAAILALPLVLAITLSEAARGRVAFWLGDKTGWSEGRLTWNPANHISLMATIVVPLAMFFATQGAFIFGNAKIIPIDYRNLRDPKQGVIWIEMASPVSLLLMALAWYLVLGCIAVAGVQEEFFLEVCKAGIFVCLSLFAFQLLPIPPLAGGRILLFSLPQKYALAMARIEPWGVWIILLLAIAGLLGPMWMRPITELGLKLLQLITMPLFALFT